MAITVINKDPERTWAVCNKCNKAYDVRKGGGCKCGNVRSEVDRCGAVLTIIEDSDEGEYDNS
jgi:hypothetical protein